MPLQWSGQVCPNSENGWILPASGTIKLLVIYAEINYTSGTDPNPNSTPGWAVGQLPTWAGSLLDQNASSTPQGTVTKYFYDASSGNYNVIGDYLVSPINGGVFTINSDTNAGIGAQVSQLIAQVNQEMGGNFLTNSGETNPLAFDNWSISSAGMPKITPSADNPGKYDHVMFIFRNRTDYDGNGFASQGTFLQPLLLGHKPDTYSVFGSFDKIPTDICRHEYAHLIMGANNFHCAGGGNQLDNYWIPATGGHSILGAANSALRCWNGWDRYWFGWKDPANQHIISARNSTGNTEVNGDLLATNPAHAGVYVLRDFVTTGDALRIKLPFLDPNTEYEQWLWIENHNGVDFSGNEFDSFWNQASTTCVDPVIRGLTAAIQIDRNVKSCVSNLYTSSNIDGVRQLSADGMWERSFDPLIQDQCTNWNTHYPSEKLLHNTLTGYGDLDFYPIDNTPASPAFLLQNDQRFISAERVGSTTNFKLYNNGNPRQMFRLSGNSMISMGTNPSSANQMNVVGRNSFEDDPKDVDNIYLNGVKVEILEMQSNGNVKVDVRFDHIDISNNIRWAAPSIFLNEIPSPSGYSLNLKTGTVLTIDHGTAATRMDLPLSFEGNQVFTRPTKMHVKSGAFINLETGSEMVIDRKSAVTLESGSRIDVQNGATLRIKRDGFLDMREGTIINVANGGKIIIEDPDGNYGAGKLKYAENCRINLNGPTASIEVQGLIELGDNAHFRLSSTNDINRTQGKIIFAQGLSTQITAGANCRVSIRGFQRNQEVVINHKTNMDFPANLLSFTMEDMRVSQNYSARIIPPISNATINVIDNVLFTSIGAQFGYNHMGLSLSGQAHMQITNCVFQYAMYAIRSMNIDLGNSLQITDCFFEHSRWGVYTYGQGVNLTDCDFEYCERPVDADHTSAPSRLTGVTTSNTPQMLSPANFDFQGAAPVYIRTCNIQNGQIGIRVEQGTAYIACTTVKSQNTNALEIINGASLYMNDAFGYGKNDLSLNPRTIHLRDANVLDLHNGYNDLRAAIAGTQNVINGTVLCFGPASITAARNRWKTSGGVPTSSDYQVMRECTPTSLLTISGPNPLISTMACFDTPPGDPELMSMGGGVSAIEMSGFEQDGSLSELDEAYFSALGQLLGTPTGTFELMSGEVGTASLGVNEEASTNTINHAELLSGLESMTEILTSPDAVVQLGEAKYMVGYTHAFDAYAEIRQAIQMGAFVADAQNIGEEVVNLTYSIGALFSSMDTELELFYYQLQLAQAHRMVGNYPQAIEAIEAAYAYTDGEEAISLADQIHCYLAAEMNTNISEEFLSSISECQGSMGVPPIQAMVSGNTNAAAAIKSLDANPNPVENTVFVSVDGEAILASEIVVFDMQGRQVRTFSNRSTERIEMQGLPTGVYMILTYFENGEVGKSKVFKL